MGLIPLERSKISRVSSVAAISLKISVDMNPFDDHTHMHVMRLLPVNAR